MEALQRMHNRGSISTGYEIDNSVKLERDDTQGFTFTNSGAGNRKTWTVSYWFKRTEPSSGWDIILGTNTGLEVGIDSNDQFYFYDGGYLFKTNRVFRDTYAWYHILIVLDTTQGTAANRIRLYVNGVEETSLATDAPPSQNADLKWNSTGIYFYVGYYPSANYYSNGYLADYYSIDGQALTPTDFGEFDEDSNIWIPKKYTGTYGTNGFKLEFKNSSALNTDTSGSSKSISLTNVSATDQATDTPTNNFPTLIPMYTPASSCILSQGGLQWDINMPSGSAFNPNTSAMSSFQVSGTNGGKWYIESKITNNNRGFVGIVSSLAFLQQTTDPTEFVYWDFYNGWIGSSLISTETNPPDAAVNTIIGIALDCDNQRVTFSKNGGWLAANGDMTGGSPSDWRWDWTSDANFLDHPNCNGNVAFWCGTQTDANVYRPIHQVNFGGYSPYTISSGNSDANGYGNFEYAVPSGFYALCTKNLAEYG